MKQNWKSISLCVAVVLLLSLSIFGSVTLDNAVTANAAPEINEPAASPSLKDAMETADFSAPDNTAAQKASVSAGDADADKAETGETAVATNDFINEKGEITVPYDIAYPEEFESGEVEYADDSIMVKFESSFNGKVNHALKKAGIAKVDLMFETEDGSWYNASLEKDADVKETMEAVRGLDSVIVAEYDFSYEACGSGIKDEGTLVESILGNSKVYDQWYLNSCGIQAGWMHQINNGYPQAGDGTVVAVIDTGVDYDHIDLAANMWKNTAEIPDNGIDDDGNGYVDDYYGVDVIAGKGNGDDDHGHGTHVAGIIAAANNKEGIVGIAYNSRIMAIKAGQSSGYFNQSDIAEGIIYAYENGADVINMSFGGSSCSIAVQDALSVAYNRCVLVASAGNDGAPNEPARLYESSPTYPAALTYVLGVMSVGETGVESTFTNWDVKNYNSVEYELYAPGEQIMSTLPNNKYAAWSGTSMAAPVVSAVAANLRSMYPDRNSYPTKFIYGQLSSTSSVKAACEKHEDHNRPSIVNAEKTYTELPQPNVGVSDYKIFDTEGLTEDTEGKNNGDGVIDAGETVALGFTLRNQWGMSKDTVVTVDAVSPGGVACPYVTINGGTSAGIDYGSIGTYSTGDCGKVITDDAFSGWENPFFLTVSSDCPNDYIITLNVTVTCKNGLDEEDTETYTTTTTVNLKIRRGTILSNRITEDMTLTADNYYIIPNDTLIAAGTTVRVEPGTQIQFWSDDPQDPYGETYNARLYVEGQLLLDGTEEERIQLFPSELVKKTVNITRIGNGYIRMKYCDVTRGYLSIDYAYACNFTGGSNYYIDTARYCVFYKVYTSGYPSFIKGHQYEFCNFVDSGIVFSTDAPALSDCVFYGNYRYDSYNYWTGSFVFQPNNFVESPTYSRASSYENSDYLYVCKLKNASIMRNYAAYLGGTPACFETKEESDVICSRYSGYNVGLCSDDSEPGRYYWVNGTPLEEWMNITENRGLSGLTFNSDSFATITTNGFVFENEYAFLYEFPSDQSPIQNGTIPESKWKEFIASGEHGLFTGNAILNRITTDTDVNHWMRIYGPESTNHDTIGLPGNYWGTTNETMIERQIVDFDDVTTRDDIDPSGYLTEAPENVWPFVVDAGLLDESGNETMIVGNETVTFYVEFNRDMDTTIPLSVRFGSAYPYADYEVEGAYVNARRWEGTTTLSTLIENGTQYLSISNGQAIPKEGEPTLKFYTDWGRFAFEIDTTEALAMTMQASATDEGIELTWYQDDFDTLAGYNVYRSTSEDGFYQKLNASVIPADTREFFDDTVEPGVVYYYNFTVVQTDFTESVPSGKVTIMAKDTMAPDMYHTPVYQAFTGSHIVVSAMVTDNVSVQNVKLYWRVTGDTEYNVTEMSKLNDKYSAVIPESYVTTAGIEYYIAAYDGNLYTYKGSAETPYGITVQQAVDDNDKGDVDGDGTITTKDAAMLLRAANDLLNLDALQFARADINGDGKLSAVEALRILKYVSGEITSILF